ncbi:MFS transporter [Ferrovibrio terrae]|uniref:MFS transporter n=1 Tax=Ferrovibrio terrae TaxID=2594003 RepID=A0A516H042_9PROT|nr:MFS transporter [Ferrovibrio terrae]QDO97122.1 MFS transporter [Ferrovibrio terrae]
MSESGSGAAGQDNSRLALLALTIAFGFIFVSRGVADSWMVFLLPVEQEFGVSRQQTAGVYSTYMLSTGLSAPLAGLMLRRFGARLNYALGVLLIGCAMLLAAQAHVIAELYIYVGVLASMGISAIGIVPASALIGHWYRHRMSVAMGAAYAGLGSGSLLMVPLAQWSIEWQGWRGTYTTMGWSLAVLLLLTLILPWHRLHGTGRAQGASGDSAAGEAGITLRRALRRPEFIGLAVSFAFTGFSMYMVIVQVVPFLVDSGYAPLKAATAFGLAGMLSVFGVISTGWLSHRYGLRPIALLSFACTFTGIFCLLGLSFRNSELLLVCFVGIFGIAQGARGPVVATMSNRLFPGPSAAAIYGVIFACSNVGAGIGAWISGYLHDASDSYRPALLLAAAGIALAAAPFLLQRAFRSPTAVV